MEEIFEPTVGPVVKGGGRPGEYRIWLRGAKPSKKYAVYGIVCFLAYTPTIYQVDLNKEDDYISCVYVKLDEKSYDKRIQGYPYIAGYYFHRKDLPYKPSTEILLKSLGLRGTINKNLKTHNLRRNFDPNTSFVFGSCRRYVNFGPIALMGTGRAGDKIYDSISNEFTIDFFLSIGDQVYLDPVNELGRRKTLKSIRELYKKVRGYPGIKYLMSGVPTYEMCDDHDAQINDSCRKTREAEPETFRNAQKAYKEYQHWLGPGDNRTHLWYKFSNKESDFFVFDTRTERDEVETMNIISVQQFEAFRKWIRDPRKRNRVKFIVSPVPMCSQPIEDSWYGFPRQQKEVLDLILGKDEVGHRIKHCFILCGDVHACRHATYSVSGLGGNIGIVTEIISSGLVAVKHDSGKPYSPEYPMDEHDYDVDNDFPFRVNNSYRGGYTFETLNASPTFPEIKRGTSNSLFGTPKHNVYTRVEVDSKQKTLNVFFKNTKGNVLYSSSIDYSQADSIWTKSLLRIGQFEEVSSSDDTCDDITSVESGGGVRDGTDDIPIRGFSDSDLCEEPPGSIRDVRSELRGKPSINRSKSDTEPFSPSRRRLLKTMSLVETPPADWDL